MNISDFEKLSAKLVFTAAVIGSTLFAGAKHGSPTNTPPMMAMLPPQTETEPALSNSNSTSNSLTNWHARGAWTDWAHISFPSGFRFPVGTNFIHEVTLMSYGEIRESLTNTAELVSLPEPVALRPGVSSVDYGLTASNSLLFAWHDAFANRDATNRINATIELFKSGSIVVTTLTTNSQPLITIPIPAPLPPDIVGEGQDEDWVRANFGDEAENILAVGYETWLGDWVGVDQANGRYQAQVTVSALPSDGSPCYLSCGPYKVNVTAPGTYRFPLEVFETYETRTYPDALPLTFAYDDGYTGSGRSYRIAAEPSHATNVYRRSVTPCVTVTPSEMALSRAVGTVVKVWCNLRDAVVTRILGASSIGYRMISSDEFVIESVNAAGWNEVLEGSYERSLRADLLIRDDTPQGDGDDPPNPPRVREDATVFEGESWHVEMTNGLPIAYLTTTTICGSTTERHGSATYSLPIGRSAYVGVFMETTEYMLPLGLCYDDSVSWLIASQGTTVLQGQSTANSHLAEFGAIVENELPFDRELYGHAGATIFLCGQRIDAVPGEWLSLSLSATAQNAQDGLRETCVQIIVFPIDDNGNVVGLPSWAR